MPFRRDFDAETIASARGQNPKIHIPAPIERSPDSRPVTRIIVVSKQPRLLSDLMAFRCAIKPRGDDWHIEARHQADLDAIVMLFKKHGIHGVLRRARPGEYSGRREPLAP